MGGCGVVSFVGTVSSGPLIMKALPVLFQIKVDFFVPVISV